MHPPIKHSSAQELGIISITIMFLISFSFALATAATGDLLGADEIISQVGKEIGADNSKVKDPGKDEADRLMRDLDSYKLIRATLSTDDAVDRWLKLYDRFWALPPEVLLKTNRYGRSRSTQDDKLSVNNLIAAISPPSTWETLKKKVLARPNINAGLSETVLRLLVYYINQDRINLGKSISELKTSASFDGQQIKYLLQNLRIKEQWHMAGKDKQNISDSYATYLQSLQAERPEGQIIIQVPDLVSLAGEEKAKGLILKTIVIPGLSMRVPSGGKTLALAKQLVREHANRLIGPQWELVTGEEDTALYEAMDKRFPQKHNKGQAPPDIFRQNKDYNMYDDNRKDEGRRRAQMNYIMGLVAQKRVAEAKEQAMRMDAEDFESSDFERIWQSFEKVHYAKELMQFCNGVLTEHPEFPLWKRCGIIAASTNETQGLIAIVTAAAEKPNLSLDSRLRIRDRQIDVLLAMDHMDEAVKLLREMVKINTGNEKPQTKLAVAQIKLKFLVRLCQLGKLLNRPELIRESEEIYIANLPEFNQGIERSFMMGFSDNNSMMETFLEKNDYAQAEKIIMTSIQSTLKSPEMNAVPVDHDMIFATGILRNYFSKLAQVYEKSGRDNDVLILMEKLPWWGATDLINLADTEKDVPVIVAGALHHTGRDPEAVNILKGYLYIHPEDDAAYRILTDITGPSIIPWLDELYARDKFEERPLIWKADLLRKQGKLDEAEITARQALKVDPTDGEQKAGDRVRGYAVLGEILKAKGKAEDAAFFERVVAAVRTAEKGDEFTKAGLIQRSLDLYEEAAKSFVDAYCIQWRLAERFSALGNMEEAKKHYEIAFERMPEQFGQVASVCFGCEGVFTHQQSRSVAEQVLTKLAIGKPQKPQVQFLLGQLREAQGRNAEAYGHFRKAVELDPDYLDAWKLAYGLRSDVFLGQKEMDDIALRMLSMDPLNRHSGINPGDINDLKGLWIIYETAAKNNGKLPTHYMTLTASKDYLTTLIKKMGGNEEMLFMMQNPYQERGMTLEAGDAVANNNFVQSLLGLTASRTGFSEFE
jgi:tetratricopeptide (TPR) repeat protein